MTATEKSYRSVPMADVGAIASAARYVEGGWGDRYSMGLAGSRVWKDRMYWLFQVRASDGSRFLVGSDRYGNCLAPEHIPDYHALALELDVEVS